MQFDTLIIGAGAASLMCATQAQGRVLLIDHAKAPGEKIRISGGGRCNFTNLNIQPDRFLSNNPHFHKSALSRYMQWDFINLVEKHKIAYHEKTLGQLFCDISAKQMALQLANLGLACGPSDGAAAVGAASASAAAGDVPTAMLTRREVAGISVSPPASPAMPRASKSSKDQPPSEP